MTGAADRTLVEAVRAGLQAEADPAAALRMQRYMKSELPYHGVAMPRVRRVARAAFAGRLLPDRASWEATVRMLFDEATHREEWYAALMLVAHRRYLPLLTADGLPMLEHVIVTGAWWDVVDDASHRVGDVLLCDVVSMEPVIDGWIGSGHLWLRRAAIICQLGHRDRTDASLLARAIEPAMAEREFFLRKAIGWALREYAKTDADWVRRFVVDHETELSTLSRREALKHLR